MGAGITLCWEPHEQLWSEHINPVPPSLMTLLLSWGTWGGGLIIRFRNRLSVNEDGYPGGVDSTRASGVITVVREGWVESLPTQGCIEDIEWGVSVINAC